MSWFFLRLAGRRSRLRMATVWVRRDFPWDHAAHSPGHGALLQALLLHPSLVPTLARLLREDGRRSLELAAAVAGVFHVMSTMSHLHAVVSELQVGALLLDLCHLEVQRAVQRTQEFGPAAAPGALAARVAQAAERLQPELSEW